jgi:benzylsuccinate CoA-transferase BbsF subunit
MPLPEMNPNLPLAGIRVIDLTSTIAGPSALRHLADYGAQVVKVESEAHPDGSRWSTPHAGNQKGLNRSGYYAAYNAGKISLSLNMRLPEAKEILSRLIEVSDIIVEAYVPGVIGRWGFDYEHVRQINPKIIMASHCLQGQTGPYRRHRGFGHLAGGMSGWYDLTGFEGEEPLGPYSAYTDFLAWPYLLNALLVALELRDLTGEGQYIDHAQIESSTHFLATGLLDLQLNGRLATRRANREDYAAPNNAYQCAGDDRWVALSVREDEEFEALCGVIGTPELAEDARFDSFAGRKINEEALDALIAAAVRDAEPFELARRLQGAGVSAGVVAKAQDLFEDPQLQHRGGFVELTHPEIGVHHVHRGTFRISGVEAGPFFAAPLLGQHTHEICSEILGYDEEQIAAYAATGVFE